MFCISFHLILHNRHPIDCLIRSTLFFSFLFLFYLKCENVNILFWLEYYTHKQYICVYAIISWCFFLLFSTFFDFIYNSSIVIILFSWISPVLFVFKIYRCILNVRRIIIIIDFFVVFVSLRCWLVFMFVVDISFFSPFLFISLILLNGRQCRLSFFFSFEFLYTTFFFFTSLLLLLLTSDWIDRRHALEARNNLFLFHTNIPLNVVWLLLLLLYKYMCILNFRSEIVAI